jgi:hypothetical protein
MRSRGAGDNHPKCLQNITQGLIHKEPLHKTKKSNTILFHVQKLSTTSKQLSHHRKPPCLVSPCHNARTGERSSSPSFCGDLFVRVSSYFYTPMHGLRVQYYQHALTINTSDSGFYTSHLRVVLHAYHNVHSRTVLVVR